MADQADATLLAAPAEASFNKAVDALGLAVRAVNAGSSGAAPPVRPLPAPQPPVAPAAAPVAPPDDATLLAPAGIDAVPRIFAPAVPSDDATLLAPAGIDAVPRVLAPAAAALPAVAILPPTAPAVLPAPGAALARPVPGAPRSLLGGIVAELVAARLLSERRAVSLGLQAREAGETLMRVLARELQAAELEPIFEFLAGRCGQPLIRGKNELTERVAEVAWLPVALSEQRGVLPLRPARDGEAPYATLDPCNLLTRDWIARISGLRPVPVPTLPDVLLETIGRLRTRVELRETDRALIPIDINWEQEQRIRDRPEAVDIPTLVDFIVHTAYEQGASDIHIEPAEDGTMVRDRIDGILHEECRMPLSLHPALTSRIKVLAGMDVAERRRPQDGRITAQIRRMPLDIRVSSSPTVLGEKIVMRLLDEKALRPAPEQLGLRDAL
ncbi:MAG: ATPase, T2SS/T4P/T4SS family, partial [Janthinobacterium lividum]